MKPITLFILRNCPYCRQALSWMEELKKENPKYGDIPLKIIDEGKEPDIASQYDYYYVPSYYIENGKIHEGVATKDIIRQVFDKSLQ